MQSAGSLSDPSSGGGSSDDGTSRGLEPDRRDPPADGADRRFSGASGRCRWRSRGSWPGWRRSLQAIWIPEPSRDLAAYLTLWVGAAAIGIAAAGVEMAVAGAAVVAVGPRADLAGGRAIPALRGRGRPDDPGPGPVRRGRGSGCSRGSGRSSSAWGSSRRVGSCPGRSFGVALLPGRGPGLPGPGPGRAGPSRPGRWASLRRRPVARGGRALPDPGMRPWRRIRSASPSARRPVRLRRARADHPREGPAGHPDVAGRPPQGPALQRPEGPLLADRRQPQPAPPGAPRGRARRGLEGLPEEPAADPLPAHRRGPPPVPRLHQRPRKRRRRRPRRRPTARAKPAGKARRRALARLMRTTEVAVGHRICRCSTDRLGMTRFRRPSLPDARPRRSPGGAWRRGRPGGLSRVM